MAFFNDLGTVIGTGAKSVADKTKELSETASYRANIVSMDAAITKLYRELGKAYYEEHKEEAEANYSDIVKEIDKAYKCKERLEERIAFAKGGMVCGKCGATISKGSAFCNVCGAKVEDFAVKAEDVKVSDSVDYYEPVREQGAQVEEGIKEAKEFFHEIKDPKAGVSKETDEFFEVIKDDKKDTDK